MSTIRPISWPRARGYHHGLPLACAVALFTACVSSSGYEKSAHRRLPGGPAELADPRTDPGQRSARGEPAEIVLDGTLDAYVAYAMAHNPGLEAAYEDWRAAVYQVSEPRRLPEPTISYGLFLRRVETRVGPQRHRIGISQRIPWPGERSARADAASAMAEAAERRFLAQASRLRRQVADAYWNLWLVREVRGIERSQEQLLAALAEATRTRIEVGRASLADLTQIDLAVSRRSDVVVGLDEREARAREYLRQVIGAPADMALPTTVTGSAMEVPAEDMEALRQSAHQHPEIESFESMARSSEHQARAADARGLPDFMVGLDYIETGPAIDPSMPQSGKDAVVLMVSMTVPIWRGDYHDDRARAQAQAAGYRARERNAENLANAELVAAMSRIRESVRRQRLIEKTLVPQAESSYSAVVGGYHTGTTALANVFMAQQSVLDLHRELIAEVAEHGRAWAHLEDVVGRPVARTTVTVSEADHE